MNNVLFLFCGGRLDESGSRLPKPLHEVKANLSILHFFMSTLPKDNWDRVFLLVESEFEKNFLREVEAIKKNIDINVSIVACENNTSTMDKFSYSLKTCDFDYATYSYPDIFVENCFWSFKDIDEIQIKKVVVKSRFPRISNTLFSEKVRGITLHSSDMPANPHYIYGGVMAGAKERFSDAMHRFSLKKMEKSIMEVDFLNYVASEFNLKSDLYSGSWILADGPRDYDLILKKHESLNQ